MKGYKMRKRGWCVAGGKKTPKFRPMMKTEVNAHRQSLVNYASMIARSVKQNEHEMENKE